MNRIGYALLACAMACGPARAEDFTFSLANGLTGGGVLTAAGDDTQGYLISAITGTVDGQTITGLAPVGSRGYNDNLLFPDDLHQLDFNGVTFFVGEIEYNLYFGTQNTGLAGYQYSYTGSAAYDFDFLAAPVGAAAVPEPATWATMIIGLGAAGVALRRKVRRSEGRFDARIRRLEAGYPA